MSICSTKWPQFVEQKLMLSFSFQCDQINNNPYNLHGQQMRGQFDEQKLMLSCSFGCDHMNSNDYY
jgi:hypothetical protein